MDQQSKMQPGMKQQVRRSGRTSSRIFYVWLSGVAKQAEQHGSSTKQATKYPNFGVRNSKEVFVSSAGKNKTSRDVCGALSFTLVRERG